MAWIETKPNKLSEIAFAIDSGSRDLYRCQQRTKRLTRELRELRSAVVSSFSQLLDLHDQNTGAHSTRLAQWGVRVARDLGLSERGVADVEMGARLHDIGKVGVPDSILNKPAGLTTEERRIVRRHPEFGWTALRRLPGFAQSSLYVLHHHENFDGTGYPARLKGAEIPIGARIVSVIDAYDAMVSVRPYRVKLRASEAIRRLHQSSGTQFDPSVVTAFIRVAETEMKPRL
jgi:HD-GYP domain-containing protein (c-di-GMP phosphodiesterase class II)